MNKKYGRNRTKLFKITKSKKMGKIYIYIYNTLQVEAVQGYLA